MIGSPTKLFRRPTIPSNSKPTTGRDEGIRTIPELIEYHAQDNPDHVFCVQGRKSARDGSLELVSVSYAQLKQCIHVCTQWLLSNVDGLQFPRVEPDGSITKGAPVALFMDSDVGLAIYLYTLMSLGIPAVLLSARLGSDGVTSLLDETASSAIIVSPKLERIAKTALASEAKHKVTDFYLRASIDELLDDSQPRFESICDPNHFIADRDRNVLILHSSGTTGLPKPIHCSHSYFVDFVGCHELAPNEALGLNVSTLPLFHGYGFVAPLVSMGSGKAICLPSTATVSTGLSVLELVETAHARSLMTVPSILEEIVAMSSQHALNVLSNLDFVAFGGGLLKEVVGSKLADAGVKLLNHFGSTESGPLAPIFVPKPDYDWRYFRLRNDNGLETKSAEAPFNGGDQYWTLVTHPPGWDQPFELQDRLIRRPGHQRDFNAVGRNDDLIVLASGEKVYPQAIEAAVNQSNLVSAAIAFGTGQFELGLLVKPAACLGAGEEDDFRASIWQLVSEANTVMDGHGRIASDKHLVILSADTILPTSDKGSLQRQKVYQVFHTAIDEFYQNLEVVTNRSVQDFSFDHLEDHLKAAIQDCPGWTLPVRAWSYDDDFFELGMDSLQALHLHRVLKASLPQTLTMTRDLVYKYPSVNQLASVIRQMQADPCLLNGIDPTASDIASRYAVGDSEPPAMIKESAVIILTGATGNLGAYVLAHLATLVTVRRIVCLARHAPNGAKYEITASRRLATTMESKGLRLSEVQWSKIQVLETDMASDFLGLTSDTYQELYQQTTHILHVAWPVDFKRSVKSFESQFRILKNLVNLGRIVNLTRPSRVARLVFISSIATVGKYPSPGLPIPEISMLDDNYANNIGYATAKLACERMLELVSLQYPDALEISYIRLGQIAGSQAGLWKQSEHIPALIKAAEILGSFPCLKGTFSWLPVEVIAGTIADIVLSEQPLRLVYHLENPSREHWDAAMDLVSESLAIPVEKSLPFRDWVSAASSAGDETNPIRPLEEFFKEDFERMACGSVVLDTTNMLKASETLRTYKGNTMEALSLYIKVWKAKGFLTNRAQDTLV